MSEDRRKSLRLQGRFSNEKSKEKEKQLGPKFHHKGKKEKNVYSGSNSCDGNKMKRSDFSLNDREPKMSVRYQENSPYAFSELLSKKNVNELKISGFYQLSETENGRSRIYYDPDFLPAEEASELMSDLYHSANWSAKDNVIRGKKVPQPRLVAWYGPFPYAYSGAMLEASEMPTSIQNLKKRIEEFLMKIDINVNLNSVLMNLYRDGKDSVAWHSDDELTMRIQPTIASISLGEVRKFEMRRKVKEKEMLDTDLEVLYLNLRHGSLLIMDGVMQKDWEHRVPKEYHDKSARINLTFRTVFPLNQMTLNVPYQTSMVIKDSFKSLALEDRSVLDGQNFPPLETRMSHSFSKVSNKNDNVHTSNGSERNRKYMKDNGCTYMGSDNYTQTKSAAISEHLCYEASKTKKGNGESLLKGKGQLRYDNEAIASTEHKNDHDKNFNFDSYSHTLKMPNDPINVAVEDGECFDVSKSRTNTILEPQNEMTENRVPFPNIAAPAFTPLQSIQPKFSTLPLRQLIEFNPNELNKNELTQFSIFIRDKILENLDNFNLNCDEKYCLRTFCKITDESQTEKNQKLILAAICRIVKKSQMKLQNQDSQ